MSPDISISVDGDDPIAEARQMLLMIDTDDGVSEVEVTLTVDSATALGNQPQATEADGGPTQQTDESGGAGLNVQAQSRQHAVLTGLSGGDYRDASMVSELSSGEIDRKTASDVLSHLYNHADRRQMLKRRKDGRGYEYLLTTLGREYRDSMPEYVPADSEE